MEEKHQFTRRGAVRTIGGVALAGLAGCGAFGDGTADEPADASAGSPTDVEGTTDAATESGTPSRSEQETETETDDADHAHTESTPSVDVTFVENPTEVHATLVEATSAPADEVLVGFRLEDSSLPFTTEVYPAAEDAEIHATETYDTQDLSDVPLVPDQPEALPTVDTEHEDVHYGTTPVGEPLAVTLVARHDGDRDLDWSAWERTGHPYDGHRETDPYLSVACYCGGENYVAPSGGTWARVIAVTPTDRVEAGTTVAVNWTSSRL